MDRDAAAALCLLLVVSPLEHASVRAMKERRKRKSKTYVLLHQHNNFTVRIGRFLPFALNEGLAGLDVWITRSVGRSEGVQ